MSIQRVCDGCGQPIDTSQPFWTISALQQQDAPIDEGAPAQPGPALPMTPTMAVTTMQLDFHEEHLPEGLKPE